jgi:hypothetical protein
MLAIEFRDPAVIADPSPSLHLLQDPVAGLAWPSPVRFLLH